MVEKETLNKVGIGLGIGGAVGVAAPLAATAALGLAGFSSGGVVAGSVATGAQAAIGNVAAGSFFSRKSNYFSGVFLVQKCPHCNLQCVKVLERLDLQLVQLLE